MVPIPSLWLPILLSAVLVFVASWIIHLVLTYHRSDVKQLPNEDQVRAALRPLGIPPGDYVIPWSSGPREMKTPEYQEKLHQGPVAFLTVLPNGPMTMGTQLVQWFLYCVVVGIVAAYVAGRTLEPGETYFAVFRIAGTVAFAGYGLALIQRAIWWRQNWGATWKSVFDALIYGLVTAGAFAGFWPR
jgi:hypothetical protein